MNPPQTQEPSPSSQEFDYELHVNCCKTPIFAIKITPSIHLLSNGESPFKLIPDHYFNLTWYREYIGSASRTETINCCVHNDKSATVECIDCEKLKLPIKGRYYCSIKCYADAWKCHRLRHFNAHATLPDDHYSHWHELVQEPEPVELEGKLWAEVCSSECYEPTMHDVGFRLRLESVAVDCSNGMHLCAVNVLMTQPVLYPRPRHMIKIPAPLIDLNPHYSSDVHFSVLSYNLLADLYVTQKKYSANCPDWALSWEYRRQALLDEIIEYDADILCLQEVQSNHFENFFKPELSRCGYSVIYKKKGDDLYTNDGYCKDGCAIFYRCDLFEGIGVRELEFDISVQRVIEKLEPGQRDDASIKLKKGNIALIVMLETMKKEGICDGTQHRICVANTHIHANQENKVAKLFQIVELITELEQISDLKIPLLICGDFNVVPLSGPYSFITNGELPNTDHDLFGLSQYLKPKHSIRLKSAYSCFFGSDGIKDKYKQHKMDTESKEPLFTNQTPRFSGTLDYIFFTEESLRLDGVLELLDREEVGCGLPSVHWPSDHIALMGSFVLGSN